MVDARVILVFVLMVTAFQANDFINKAEEKLSNFTHVAMNKTKAAGEKVAGWGKNAAHAVEDEAKKIKDGITHHDQ